MNEEAIREKYMMMAEEEMKRISQTFLNNLKKDGNAYNKFCDDQLLTPKEAIIAKCLYCTEDRSFDCCPDKECPLFDVLSSPDFFEY